MRLVGRLHERANRPCIATKQSRRLAPECRDGAGLGLGLGTDPESSPAVIETRALGKVGVPRGTKGLPFLFSTLTAKQVLERLRRDLGVLGVLF